MNRHMLIPVLLAAGIYAVACTGPAVAQQPAAKTQSDNKSSANVLPGKPAAKALEDKPVYDIYEPSQRLRTRRQECVGDEEPMGAYCAKKCQTGYQMEINGKYARCRALKPLPPGSLPSPIRKEIGTQPKLPEPAKPQPRQPGA